MYRLPFVVTAVFLFGCGDVAPSSATDAATATSTADPLVVTTQVDLSNTPAPSTLAFNFGKNIAVDGRGQLHVVWTEGAATNPSVAYKRSPDGGTTWTTTWTFGPSSTTSGVRVAAAGDDIYLVWRGNYGSTPGLYLIHSSDAGTTFSAPKLISDPGIDAAFPTIAAWGPEVHIAWSDDRSKLVGGVADTHAEVYVRNSTDHGATFSSTVAVSVPDHHSSWTPAISAQGGVVHVAWTDERWDTVDCADIDDTTACHEEEYYRRSADAGATWGPEVRLTTDVGAPKASWAPSIVATASNVYISYFDFRTGTPRIYFQRSTDTGVTWPAQATGEQLLSDPLDTFLSARPVVAAIGDAVRIVYWRQSSNAADVYITASASGGTAGSWVTPVALTANIGHTTVSALQPSMALAPTGENHVIWMDDRTGADDIYYEQLQ